MDRLYNEELKLAYIDDYFGEESSKQAMIYEFYKSAMVEKEKERDLYAFFEDDITDLLYSLASSSINSLEKSVSVYKDYINWCIKNGKRGKYENGENKMDVFQKIEDLKKYISNRKISQTILTKTELKNLVNYLVNTTDQALIVCMYELMIGTELHEIRHLSIHDVLEAEDNENLLKLHTASGEERHVQVDRSVTELLKEAYREKTYIGGNGFPDALGRVYERELSDTKYIFRLSRRKHTVHQPVSYSGIQSKMQNIKSYTGYEFITPSAIRDTRIVHEIVDMKNKLGRGYADEDIYQKAFERIEDKYNLTLSYHQRRSVIAKYEQAFVIKDY